MSSRRHFNRLPRIWETLEQARRILRELSERERNAEAYRDHLPWTLDRLDNGVR